MKGREGSSVRTEKSVWNNVPLYSQGALTFTERYRFTFAPADSLFPSFVTCFGSPPVPLTADSAAYYSRNVSDLNFGFFQISAGSQSVTNFITFPKRCSAESESANVEYVSVPLLILLFSCCCFFSFFNLFTRIVSVACSQCQRCATGR